MMSTIDPARLRAWEEQCDADGSGRRDVPMFLEQFAYMVVDYTSKYNNMRCTSYGPENLVGPPVRYPNYGEDNDTYTLRISQWSDGKGHQQNYMPQEYRDIESEDYVVVRFEQAVWPTGVFIYETFNPGAVVRLWGHNSKHKLGRWHLMYEGAPQLSEQTACKFQPELFIVHDTIDEVRIELNQTLRNCHVSLDAVHLSGYVINSPLQFRLYKAFHQSAAEKKPSMTIPVEDIDEEKCYIADMPNEVLFRIFGFLDFKSLARCARVNHNWNAIASYPTMYQELNFKRYWHCLRDDTLIHFMSFCKYVRKLDLSWCGCNDSLSEDMVVKFLQLRKDNLTHVALNNCAFVRRRTLLAIGNCKNLVGKATYKMNFTGFVMCSSPVIWIITDGLKLNSTLLRWLKQPESKQNLRLRFAGFTAPADRDAFFALSQLNQLVAVDLSFTFITTDDLLPMLKANPSLKHIYLDYCEYLSNFDEIAHMLSINNPGLITFCAWNTRSLTPIGISYLANCHQLEELDLGWCLVTTDPGESVAHIARGCPNIRRLILAGWRGISDWLLLPLKNSNLRIEQLDLTGIHNITDYVCQLLLDSLTELRMLDLSYCHSVSNDCVRYWRHLYPNVVIHRSCLVAYSEDA